VFRDLGALRIPRGVRIRKDDALQGSAALFDVSLVALHEHVERLQALGRSTLSELEARLEADPHFEGPLRELRLRLHALAEETARFQLLPRAPYPEPPPAAPAPVEPPRADAKPQEPLEEPVAPDSAVR
jgi:hypothetical protein